MLAGGLCERTPGAAGHPLAAYRRRPPERTALHELVVRHAQTLLAELQDAEPTQGGGLFALCRLRGASLFDSAEPGRGRAHGFLGVVVGGGDGAGSTTWSHLMSLSMSDSFPLVPR